MIVSSLFNFILPCCPAAVRHKMHWHQLIPAGVRGTVLRRSQVKSRGQHLRVGSCCFFSLRRYLLALISRLPDGRRERIFSHSPLSQCDSPSYRQLTRYHNPFAQILTDMRQLLILLHENRPPAICSEHFSPGVLATYWV